MDRAAIRPDVETEHEEGEELRRAPRFTLLIRAAKLTCDDGDFVCVIRDVSSTGVSVKLFHDLPVGENMSLVLQCGSCYDIRRVWAKDREAGFEFTGQVDVDRLISEVGEFPKRGIRLGLQFPVTIGAMGQRFTAKIENISQQGAKLECNSLLAIDQSLRLESEQMREIRAKVRWRDGVYYGLVFDDTFSLKDLAGLAARIQCPALLEA